MRKYVFADESGCLTFKRGNGASKYFILCTVTIEKCEVANALLELRRRLAWDKYSLGEYFHAAQDAQVVRDEVFKTILSHDFKVQATIMEKSKAQPQVTVSKERFYQYGWFYHFQHGLAKHLKPNDELHIVAASIGTKKGQRAFTSAVNDVVRQTIKIPRNQWVTDFCPAATDPCLQLADYCSWAIQRKWEGGYDRSFKLIENRISYIYDLWGHGTKHHY